MSGHDNTCELRKPLITQKRTYGEITNDVLLTIQGPPSTAWYVAFSVAVLTLIMGIIVVAYQVKTGIGTWGLNKTIGWKSGYHQLCFLGWDCMPVHFICHSFTF